MKLKKLIVLLVLTFVLGSTAIAAGSEVVATVNGVAITLEQFYETLENDSGFMVLQQMIIDELVNQKQAALNVNIDPNALALTYSDIIYQLGGQEGYRYFLQQYGITDQQFRAQMEWELLLTELARAEIEVTPEDVIYFFEQNKSYFDQAAQVKASHILVETEAEANNIITQLNNGGDFAALASELSLDPGTQSRGGDLGYFGKGTMVPEFETLAFSLETNKYDKVQTNYGWHVVLVTDKLEAKPADLNEQWDYVEETLVQYLASDLNSYVQKLLAEAQIEILRERYITQ